MRPQRIGVQWVSAEFAVISSVSTRAVRFAIRTLESREVTWTQISLPWAWTLALICLSIRILLEWREV